jgi:L-alanine-DL-glutamate epimerase-like enolase superfamily enzyme
MNKLIIERVDKTWISVPLKTRHARHLTRENWDWTVMEILRLYTNSDLVGTGETMCYYTWRKVPQEQIDRVVGHSPFEFLDDDTLGAGLQMAIYDLAGKAMGVPCYKLLGPKVRDWCPASWWTNDMSQEDWIDEMREALSLGYMSAKLKARPWRDFVGIIETLAGIVPSDFRFDADYNGFLHDVGIAVPHIVDLERTSAVGLLESPLPQHDIEGNAMLRKRITRPIAMHYGSPTIDAAIAGQVCDGFVIGGGAHMLRQQAAVAAQFNKPFFLQLVGTGLTTAFMLHFGATLTHATWPAVTCHEIYVDDMITERIEVRQGYMHVPEAPGLGVELDEDALARYRVEPGYMPPPPRNLYRVSWPSGHSVVYPVGKRDISWNLVGKTGVWDDFAAGNQPLFHRGVKLEIIPDDGNAMWQDLWERAKQAPVRE